MKTVIYINNNDKTVKIISTYQNTNHPNNLAAF